jgi:hypothetical protein
MQRYLLCLTFESSKLVLKPQPDHGDGSKPKKNALLKLAKFQLPRHCSPGFLLRMQIDSTIQIRAYLSTTGSGGCVNDATPTLRLGYRSASLVEQDAAILACVPWNDRREIIGTIFFASFHPPSMIPLRHGERAACILELLFSTTIVNDVDGPPKLHWGLEAHGDCRFGCAGDWAGNRRKEGCSRVWL